MKKNLYIIKDIIDKRRDIFIFCIIMLLLWIIPIKAENVSLKIFFYQGNDGDVLEWSFINDNQYYNTYNVETIVCDKSIKLKLDPRYIDSTEIIVDNQEYIDCIKSVEIYSGNYTLDDNKIGKSNSISNLVDLQDFIIKTTNNNWILKVYISIVLCIIMCFWIACKRLKVKGHIFESYMLLVIVLLTIFSVTYIKAEYKNCDILIKECDSDEYIQITDSYYEEYEIKNDDLSGLRIPLLCSGENGKLLIELIDISNDKCIYRDIIFTSEIKEDTEYEVTFDEVHNSKGDIYSLYIKNMSDIDGVYIGCDKKTNNAAITFVYHTIHNVEMAISIIITISLLCLIVVCGLLYDNEIKIQKAIIIGIYSFFIFYSLFRIFFYREYVQRTPDESRHISYIIYEKEHSDIIPNYDEMIYYDMVKLDKDHIIATESNPVEINYLGHPPLYYHILGLFYDASYDGNNIIINIKKLRYVSITLYMLGILLLFYIGYTRIKKSSILHLFYATICTSVPMSMYTASGVNNDSLCILTVAIFLLGVIRFDENKRNLLTYMLISIGISTSLMTKYTAGIMLLIASFLIVLTSVIREKSLGKVLNKYFWLSSFVYIIPLVFMIIVFSRFGTIQVSLQSIDPDTFYKSGFYVDFKARDYMTLIEYLFYYFKSFFNTWVSIASHTSLYKTDVSYISLQRIGLMGLWLIPLLFILLKIDLDNRKSLKYMYISVLVTMIIQLKRVYSGGYIVNGYLGAYQSRYYICCIAVFGLLIVMGIQRIIDKLQSQTRHNHILRSIVYCVILCYIVSLLYEDFLYFVLNYNEYLII